jgi:D-beta-D-heptose 7-phosphate kinase/D-beta-D-heptose 1-phosphate adenosyltransferase
MSDPGQDRSSMRGARHQRPSSRRASEARQRCSPGPLLVVGDALLDRDLEGRVERLSPDAPAAPVVDELWERPRPGGAALAATLASLLDGREVLLVTALASDEPSRLLAELLRDAGVAVVDLGLAGPTPEKVRVRTDGRTLLRLDRGGRQGTVGAPGDAALLALAGARAVLVADYGRGVTAEPAVRAALTQAARRVPVVWDPHPNGEAPVAGVRLATPNRSEVARLGPKAHGNGLAALAAQAHALAARWEADGVAVTLAERGALLVGADGRQLLMPARPVRGSDPCGAGDRFAAAVTGLLADGAAPPEAVACAVQAASAFVANGGAASLEVARDALVLPYRASRRREVVPGDSG